MDHIISLRWQLEFCPNIKLKITKFLIFGQKFLLISIYHQWLIIQKQSLAVVLLIRCFEKFRKFHKKTPVSECQTCNFNKKTLQHRSFLVTFVTLFFKEYLRWLLLMIGASLTFHFNKNVYITFMIKYYAQTKRKATLCSFCVPWANALSSI